MLNSAQTVRDGRIFRANLLAASYAHKCWQYGSLDPARPVFCVFAGPMAEMRPFVANIKEDGKLRMYGPMAGSTDSKGAALEFMKSTAYNYDVQVHDLAIGPAVDPDTGRKRIERPGVICTVYQPALYNLDPIVGINVEDDSEPFHYICMPGADRLSKEADLMDNKEIVSHLHTAKFTKFPAQALHTFGAHAALVCAGIDRRLDIPIIHDPRFYAQLVAAMLDTRLASWGVAKGEMRGYRYSDRNWGHNPELSYIEENVTAVGYAPGICVSATRAEAIAIIGAQTARFERILSGLDPDAGAGATVAVPSATTSIEDEILDPDPDTEDEVSPSPESGSDAELSDDEFCAQAALSDAIAMTSLMGGTAIVRAPRGGYSVEQMRKIDINNRGWGGQ